MRAARHMAASILPNSSNPKGLPMHIRAFIGAAVLAFCTLAIVPAVTAMDHSPPDICVLDLSVEQR